MMPSHIGLPPPARKKNHHSYDGYDYEDDDEDKDKRFEIYILE